MLWGTIAGFSSCASANTSTIPLRILGLSHLQWTEYILFLMEFAVWGFRVKSIGSVTLLVCLFLGLAASGECPKRLELSEFVTIWLHRIKESQINTREWNQLTKVPGTAQTSPETRTNWKQRQNIQMVPVWFNCGRPLTGKALPFLT